MCYAHLTQRGRYQIQAWIQAGESVQAIASALHVHRSTVYRERKRGADRHGHYSAARAQRRAQHNQRRSAANHPVKPVALWRRVERKIRRDWAPVHVRGWLNLMGYPLISVPAIYAYIERNRMRKGTLHRHLRYAARRQAASRARRPWLRDLRPRIRQRPAHVAQRREIGHWEGDTMVSSNHRHKMIVLVERHSRYLILKHPQCSWSHPVAEAIVEALSGYPVLSITFDNGTEFASYPLITQGLNCDIYFADPGKPNQRGTCESTIGLLRQYIPKGTCGWYLSERELKHIVNRLNRRPRECLGFRTPHEVFFNKPPVALRS
jgi:IS30 family transposase